MIRDITIGQYYPARSVLHRLDPRVKLVATLLYLISLFLFKNILGYLVTTVFLIAIIKLSKVPFRYIMRGMKPIMMLLLITLLFNLFLTREGDVLFHAWIFTNYRRWFAYSNPDGNPPGVSDHRVFDYDVDDHTE